MQRSRGVVKLADLESRYGKHGAIFRLRYIINNGSKLPQATLQEAAKLAIVLIRENTINVETYQMLCNYLNCKADDMWLDRAKVQQEKFEELRTKIHDRQSAPLTSPDEDYSSIYEQLENFLRMGKLGTIVHRPGHAQYAKRDFEYSAAQARVSILLASPDSGMPLNFRHLETSLKSETNPENKFVADILIGLYYILSGRLWPALCHLLTALLETKSLKDVNTMAVRELVTLEDLQLYVGFLAATGMTDGQLVTLKDLGIFSSSSLIPRLLESILSKEFKQTSSLLDSLSERFACDPFLGSYTATVAEQIRARVALNDLSLYQSVSISRLASLWEEPEPSVVRTVLDCIKRGGLDFKIDMIAGTLERKRTNQISNVMDIAEKENAEFSARVSYELIASRFALDMQRDI